MPNIEATFILEANRLDKRTLNEILDYANNNPIQTPCLVLAVNGIKLKFEELASSLPQARIFYAVKANPAQDILKCLNSLGSNFDAASPNEFRMCLEAGANPANILYSNTIKKPSEIAETYRLGCRIYCFDSVMEAEKLARFAPGSRVICRIMTEGKGAAWPLSKKFGCTPGEAPALLQTAEALGLEPFGVSFHVGSQMLELQPWDDAIAMAAQVFNETAKLGIALKVLNLGGGFPAQYRTPIPSTASICATINASLEKHFAVMPEIFAEPGRFISAEAGVLFSEVILISRHEDDTKNWVYIDAGKFTGLFEPEAIEYEILTDKDGGRTMPIVLAGPTCDSVDIIYENADYHLPEDINIGDRVMILATGAYTTTYSAVGFNGFPPLKEIILPPATAESLAIKKARSG